MKDTRLTVEELDTFVAIAYGGPAYRAGRRAQARALGNLVRGRPLDGTPAGSSVRASRKA